jgi:hypothetical protein
MGSNALTVQFSKLPTQDMILNRIQDNIFVALLPLSNDVLFDRQEIVITLNPFITTNVIPHNLKREPKGWLIVDRNAAGDIYRTAWTNENISIKSSAQITVTLWVF